MGNLKTSTTTGMGKVGEGFGKMGKGVGEGFGKVGKGMGDGFGKVADFTTSPFKAPIPIAEVREDELKERPMGHEQALAYQKKQRRRGFWIFGGPVDFEEPMLPSDSGGMEGGLLPPKME